MRTLLTLVLALFIAMPAYAGFSGGKSGGFSGPGQNNGTTVQDAKKLRDDAPVTLTGNIVSRISGDKYVFRDATGEITIDIDDEDFRGQDVTPNDTVRIMGDVDKEFGRGVEIDVKRLEVLR